MNLKKCNYCGRVWKREICPECDLPTDDIPKEQKENLNPFGLPLVTPVPGYGEQKGCAECQFEEGHSRGCSEFKEREWGAKTDIDGLIKHIEKGPPVSEEEPQKCQLPTNLGEIRSKLAVEEPPKRSWEYEFDYKFPPTTQEDCKRVFEVKAFLSHTIEEGRAKLVEEIIENIPLCRDRITKCNCHDHDINDEVFGYLEELRANPTIRG